MGSVSYRPSATSEVYAIVSGMEHKIPWIPELYPADPEFYKHYSKRQERLTIREPKIEMLKGKTIKFLLDRLKKTLKDSERVFAADPDKFPEKFREEIVGKYKGAIDLLEKAEALKIVKLYQKPIEELF